MKINILTSFALGLLFLSSPASAFNAKNCKKNVYSKGILKSIEDNYKKELDRHETTYTLGVNLNSYSKPKFCSSKNGIVTVALHSRVNTWTEEGEIARNMKTTCFMLFAYEDGWDPMHLFCEDLDIDEGF